MKKYNVKVKPKKTKKSSGRAYIVLTALCAAMCALVFSIVARPDKKIEELPDIDISGVTPEEIAQVSEQVEIEVPQKNPEPLPEKAEPEPKEEPKEEKTFNGEFSLPVSGEVINEYSGSKPVKSKTTGEWRVHSGIDIKASEGTSVLSPADGKILEAYDDKLTGLTVKINHGEGYISTLYNLGKISVNAGEKVEKGKKIGTVGKSALIESKEEPHIHFEIKKDGKFINPKEYIEQ